MIIVPKKLLLDTNHLINLAKLRIGELYQKVDVYERLGELIRCQACGLVFSEFAPLEWVEGGGTQQSAHEIAAIFESSPLVYQIEGDSMIWLREVLMELHRIDSAIPAIEYPICWARRIGESVPRALGIIASRVPGYVGDSPFQDGPALSDTVPMLVPSPPISEYVDLAFDFRVRRPLAYRERTNGYQASLTQDLSLYVKGIHFEAQFAEWAMRFLRIQKVLESLAPGKDTLSLMSQVELQRCPSIKLWFKAREMRLRKGAQQKSRPNDVHDWEPVAAIPYLDVVLTERQLRGILHEADPALRQIVVSDPIDAVRLIEAQ